MRKERIFNVLGIIMIIAGVIIFIMSPSTKENCINSYSELRSESYIGIVTKKYVDKDEHYFITVEIKLKDEITSWILDNDKSGLYDYLKIGDSIVKKNGTYKVRIYRKSKVDTVFILDYGCDDL
jgi:predicted house-cleaning noncanonical NTP pyrophosphatase (MazG superfamily)